MFINENEVVSTKILFDHFNERKQEWQKQHGIVQSTDKKVIDAKVEKIKRQRNGRVKNFTYEQIITYGVSL